MAQSGKMSNRSGTPPSFDHLYERLVAIRSHFDLSQTEMSEKAGVSLRAYRNYEYGEREATIPLVQSLYETLDISPIWLMTGQGSMLEEAGKGRKLDNHLLQQVIEAVENFASDLPNSLSVDHKSRLIVLLYEKARLLSEVTGEKLNPSKLENILKLVA